MQDIIRNRQQQSQSSRKWTWEWWRGMISNILVCSDYNILRLRRSRRSFWQTFVFQSVQKKYWKRKLQSAVTQRYHTNIGKGSLFQLRWLRQWPVAGAGAKCQCHSSQPADDCIAENPQQQQLPYLKMQSCSCMFVIVREENSEILTSWASLETVET